MSTPKIAWRIIRKRPKSPMPKKSCEANESSFHKPRMEARRLTT
jgi:hypothetical protein